MESPLVSYCIVSIRVLLHVNVCVIQILDFESVLLCVCVLCVVCFFVFFKQKTAYEIQYGLVGSEMCIRDRYYSGRNWTILRFRFVSGWRGIILMILFTSLDLLKSCLLYTSDAADERSSVDLGGRRIIKKKTNVNILSLSTVTINNYNHYSQTSHNPIK